MEKFKKYMRILDKGLNAVGIAFLVVSIVLAVFAVIGFIGIEGIKIGEVDTVLELGIFELELDESVIVDSETVNNLLAIICIIKACEFLTGWFFVKLLKKFVCIMKDGDIFNKSVPKAIRNLSEYVLLYGFISEVINVASTYISTKFYDVSALFNMDAVSEYFCNFDINGNFIIYAAIIYLLSYVFKYGAELQTQVDETL